MNRNKQLGDRGEAMVADYLRQKGFIISARNYHSRFGEIDIVAENAELILFVEVKLRGAHALAQPAEFVDFAKRLRIISTAEYYIYNNGVVLQPRFDVAEVFSENARWRLHYIENAFGADGK